MRKIIAWTIVIICVPMLAMATVYYRKDAQGNAVFTDDYSSQSKAVKLPNLSTFKRNKSGSAPKASGFGKQKSTGSLFSRKPSEHAAGQEYDTPRTQYKAFNFVNVVDQQTFHNQRQIPIRFEISPELQEGDLVQLIVDGHQYSSPSNSPTAMINNLDRGTHTIQAHIIDSRGQVLKKTPVITVYIKYASVRNPPFGPTTPNSSPGRPIPLAPATKGK